MKKCILKLTAILLIFAGSFSACKEKENGATTFYAKKARIDISENEFVEMYFSPSSDNVNFSPIKLMIENHTEGVLIYRYDIGFEYFNVSNWQPTLGDWRFTDTLYNLMGGKTVEQELDFVTFLDGAVDFKGIKKGKYRMVKNFDLSYNFSLKTGTIFSLYLEFEIK